MRSRFVLGALPFLLFLLQLTQDPAFSFDPRNQQDPQAVVEAYFVHLKNGDLDAIHNMIEGNLKKHRKMLKTGSNDYSNFLRNYYKDTQLGSIEVDYINENVVECKLNIYRDGEIGVLNLILSRVGNTWRITDDRTD